LRRRETLKRRGTSGRASEVRAVVVGGVLLFVGRQVAKVRLHRSDVRLVLRVGELRNRDRGKNTDDNDHDQKLDKSKTLLAANHIVSLSKESDWRKAVSVLRSRQREDNRQAIGTRSVARLGEASGPDGLEESLCCQAVRCARTGQEERVGRADTDV